MCYNVWNYPHLEGGTFMNNQKFGPMPLYALSLGGGAAGFILRLLMLKLGYDRHGVQISGHWTYWLLWLLSLGVLGGLAWVCRGMGQRNGREENRPASLTAAIGASVAAVMLFGLFFLGLLGEGTALDKVSAALGLMGAMTLGVNGWLRKEGKENIWAGLLTTMALALHLIARFRVWATDPLLGDYCFQLLGCVAAMLAAYHLSGFAIDKGSRRQSLFFSFACLFFCILNLADGGRDLLFFGGIGIWQLTNVCNPAKPRKPRRKLGGGLEESEGSDT